MSDFFKKVFKQPEQIVDSLDDRQIELELDIDKMSDAELEKEKLRWHTKRLREQAIAEARRNSLASGQVCLVEESKEAVQKILNTVIQNFSQLPDIALSLDGDKAHNKKKLEEWLNKSMVDLNVKIEKLR